MGAINIEAINVDDLMLRIEGKINENAERATAKACAYIEGEAKMLAPKGEGELARSIKYKVEKFGDEIQGTVFTPLEYAPYVEFGTGLFAEEQGREDVPWHYKDEKGEWHTTYGMHPHPYLRPAIINNRERIMEIIKEGLSD